LSGESVGEDRFAKAAEKPLLTERSTATLPRTAWPSFDPSRTAAASVTKATGTAEREAAEEMIVRHALKAVLGFHAAWQPTANGGRRTGEAATEAMYEVYPSNVRRWIDRHGGLSGQIILLKGRELAQMVVPTRSSWPQPEAAFAHRSSRPAKSITNEDCSSDGARLTTDTRGRMASEKCVAESPNCALST
jgi:hypothetical protein